MAGHDLVCTLNFTAKTWFDGLLPSIPDHDFRSGYTYNNLLVMTAGYLVGKFPGQGWRIMSANVFEPLK